MMMAMLNRGGLPALYDEARAPDRHNPRGYFELRHVKSLGTSTDQPWISEARGRCLKVVAPLLERLPGSEQYRVVLMRRDIGEVLASQRLMLQDLGYEDDDVGSIATVLAREVDRAQMFVTNSDNVRSLDVGYADVINKPAVQAQRIDAFLGGGLDLEAMARVVCPALYRQHARDVGANQSV